NARSYILSKMPARQLNVFFNSPEYKSYYTLLTPEISAKLDVAVVLKLVGNNITLFDKISQTQQFLFIDQNPSFLNSRSETFKAAYLKVNPSQLSKLSDESLAKYIGSINDQKELAGIFNSINLEKTFKVLLINISLFNKMEKDLQEKFISYIVGKDFLVKEIL